MICQTEGIHRGRASVFFFVALELKHETLFWLVVSTILRKP